MELEFQIFFFFFFLSLIAPYLIFYKLSFTLKLNFEKIELQKRGISLISLGKGVEGYITCAKRAFAQIPRSYEVCNNFSLHSLGDMIYNKLSFYKNENHAF